MAISKKRRARLERWLLDYRGLRGWGDDPQFDHDFVQMLPKKCGSCHASHNGSHCGRNASGAIGPVGEEKPAEPSGGSDATCGRRQNRLQVPAAFGVANRIDFDYGHDGSTFWHESRAVFRFANDDFEKTSLHALDLCLKLAGVFEDE